jgi:alpha-glucosidase (family GH31 glycosyl hydrolase)
MKKFVSYLLLFTFSTLSAQIYNPVSNHEATVVVGNARFTVLTPNTIRIEWAQNAKFEDKASLTFVNRNLPVPFFTKKETKSTFVIKTNTLTLIYIKGDIPFSKDNLKIEFKKNGKIEKWIPGLEDAKNLLGTTRTLDNCNGGTIMNKDGKTSEPVVLENGIISRNGWQFIDDSKRPLFDNSDWAWVNERPNKNLQDWYFLFYGDDYKAGMSDFTKIAGKIALPPKFAFGYWYSKFWAYSDQEYKELVSDFAKYDLPLDVLVMDMDWHIADRKEWYNENGKRKKDQAGENIGWTGFTWNKKYFPSPEKFLKWTDDQNLKTCMNLHPASGIQPHEDAYPEFAKAMGIDPETKKYVPFDITNKTFAKNYFDIVLHPLEKQGIDFWWLDWQQWGSTKIEGVNPTFYLNYVHFSDMERENKVRPIIFHRWGGLGNHRYQIGFSGDTWVSWKSLDYQPYFTSTAANVGYGFWSHDIGGHFNGTEESKKDPELYTRWVQFGAFSPILRTHSTKDPTIERRPWYYPVENFQIVRNTLKLRYAMIPYIYTAARYAHDTGVSMIHPMYYDYSNQEESYHVPGQYMFGNDMIVSPITHPMGKDSLFTFQKTWLPEGEWIEWSTGTILSGGEYINRTYTLSETPVFIRSGAIIPMQQDMKRVDEKPTDLLILNVFPGISGKSRVYDDEGNNSNYLKGNFTFTQISSAKSCKSLKITIEPIEGNYVGMPTERAYEIRIPISYPAVNVKINGIEVFYTDSLKSGSWSYDGQQLTTLIKTQKVNVHSKVEIEVTLADEDIHLLSGLQGDFSRAFDVSKGMHYLGYQNKKDFLLDDLVDFVQAGNRITLNPGSIKEEITTFKQKLPAFKESLEEIIKIDTKFDKVAGLFNTIQN